MTGFESPSESDPDSQDVHHLYHRWHTVPRRNGDALPPLEEIAFGSLGSLADQTAIVQPGADDSLEIIREAPQFAAWLRASRGNGLDAADGARRSDCERHLSLAVHQALRDLRPAFHRARRIENGVIETYELLVLPLRSPWTHSPLGLAFISEPTARSSLVDRLYQSSNEGLLALAPVRDESGALRDLQIVALNAGAGRLMRKAPDELLWQYLSGLQLGLRSRGVMERLLRVIEQDGQAEFELSYTLEDGSALYLEVSASCVDEMLSVTLICSSRHLI